MRYNKAVSPGSAPILILVRCANRVIRLFHQWAANFPFPISRRNGSESRNKDVLRLRFEKRARQQGRRFGFDQRSRDPGVNTPRCSISPMALGSPDTDFPHFLAGKSALCKGNPNLVRSRMDGPLHYSVEVIPILSKENELGGSRKKGYPSCGDWMDLI